MTHNKIESNLLLDGFPDVTHTEIMKAIQHLSFVRAPGSHAIPAEICKVGGIPMADVVDNFTYTYAERSHKMSFLRRLKNRMARQDPRNKYRVLFS